MESRTLSSYRWVVLLVSCLIIFIADYIQFQLSALATEIMPALGIDVAQFSALLLAPLLAGVFVSIPGGSLVVHRVRCDPRAVVRAGEESAEGR